MRVWATVGTVVAATAGLVAVAFTATSADQALADAAPPEPATITATIERRELRETVVIDGRVTAGSVVAVPTPQAEGDELAVLTLAPLPVGTDVASGDVLAVVSGRPLFVLPGVLPAFRDLRPGDAGPDVEQLQESLVSAGFAIDDAQGVFGPSTSTAVASLYERAGFSPRLTSDDLPEVLAEAEQQVEDATAGLAAARREAGRAAKAGEREAVSAVTAVRAARERSRAARTQGDGMIAVARAELRAVQRERSRILEDPESSPRERDDAEVAVARAEAVVADTIAAAAVLLAEAAADVEAAESRAAAARDARGDDEQMRTARREVARAEGHLAALRARTGAMLPRDEVVLVPVLPAVVASSAGELGATAPEDDPLLTLSSGDLIVTGQIDLPAASVVEVGMAAEVGDVATGAAYEAIVSDVSDGGDGPVTVTVVPVDPLPGELAGHPASMTILAAGTAEPVLAAPVSAIRTRADGTAVVTVVTADDEQHQVVVVIGRTAGGWAEVVDTELRAGTRVVVSP